MTRYIGLDVHKRFVEYCILDAAGKKLTRGQTPCVRSSLEAFATKILQPTDHVALEASTNTWSVVAILRPHVAQLVVGNPLRTKAIAEAKIKTDKVDAEVLAQLLRCDYLPSVWQPDPDTELMRRLTTQHATLMPTTKVGGITRRLCLPKPRPKPAAAPRAARSTPPTWRRR